MSIRVAIDGPAGSGKSTLARALARELDLPYVNTGLMYRALTRRALDEGIDLDDQDALVALARTLDVDLDLSLHPPELRIDGRAAGAELATPRVEGAVSLVSSHPGVRRVMVERQRELGAAGAVMEGRDIGRVVLPDATAKIYLDAGADERAGRRSMERGGAAMADALARRDRLDAKTNPFVPADDAIRLDTSGLTPEETLAEAMTVVAERIEAGSVVTHPPVVAVVGRQNVGKSTLVNRLFGSREAIAHELPGVTRDRIEIPVEWRGRSFVAVDTGGYVTGASGIEALVAEQADRAAAGADLVLLVVDAATGIQEEDAVLARRLQRASVPIVVVVNKVDTERQEPDVAEFHSLGLGEPIPVSALHGRASGELLDRVLDLLPEPEAEEPEVEGEPSFAVVGRPNVGKSSLFNRLVGEQRSVVYEQAGTTRDAVDAVVEWPEGSVRFVDTAGLRRAARMQGIDYYSFVRAARAIDRANVSLLVIDAIDGLTADDKHIAARVMESGKGLMVAANKWDLVPSEEKVALLEAITEDVIPFAWAPVVRLSALTGQGVNRLPQLLTLQHGRWTRRVSTSEVNRVLERAQDERPPLRGITRFRYGTQVSAGPPSFVLFGGRVPDPGYRRFLENRFRRAFDLEGIPIRMRFRARKGARLGATGGRSRG